MGFVRFKGMSNMLSKIFLILFICFSALGLEIRLSDTYHKLYIDKEFEDKQANFVPSFSFVKWNGENTITFKYRGDYNSTFFEKTKNHILSKDENRNIGFKITRNNKKDGFKFILILYEKPKTNEFFYDIEGWEEFHWWYQPTLENEYKMYPRGNKTLEEFLTKHSRPDNVVGSYAVYHKTKRWHRVGGVNYGCGKFMHVFRPRVYDSDGRNTYATIEIVKWQYKVTVPQNIIDNAVYPLYINDTFGYGQGASTTDPGGGIVIASGSDSPASNGTATSIDVYSSNSTSTTDVKVGLYDDSSGPNNLVSPGENETTDVGTWSDSWKSFTSASITVSSATTYWIGVSRSAGFTLYYDVNGGTNRYYDNVTYASAWNDPFDNNGSSGAEYSFRCTYTPSASGPKKGAVVGC